MALKGIKITVKGRVQGVFYRSSAQEEAKRLGLSGWVKNEAGGNVQILAEGEEDRLLELIEWARKGPELSHVDEINFEWLAYTGDYHSFEIRH
jgi:acylphosphatase